jgi:hypothetical protein
MVDPRPLLRLGQATYKFRATRVPRGPEGANWLGFFNSQLSGGQFLAHHDGNEIVAECEDRK